MSSKFRNGPAAAKGVGVGEPARAPGPQLGGDAAADAGQGEAAGIESGAKTVGTQIVGKATKQQVEEIAKQKMPDLNCDSVESAMAQVVGSARSMGLQVVE